MKRIFFKSTEAVSKNETMEADTILKNGRSSKSHKSRGNMILLLSLCLFAFYFYTACSFGNGSPLSVVSPNNKIIGVWERVENQYGDGFIFFENGRYANTRGSGVGTYSIYDNIIMLCYVGRDSEYQSSYEFDISDGSLTMKQLRSNSDAIIYKKVK
jgi:hypothetical protein